MTPIFHPLRDGPHARSSRQTPREEQAFYEKHAEAGSSTAVLGWLAAAALLIVFAVLAVPATSHGHESSASKRTGVTADENSAPQVVDRYQLAGTPLTVFVDGPTGFVFVYTEDGWKFVRGSGDRNL